MAQRGHAPGGRPRFPENNDASLILEGGGPTPSVTRAIARQKWHSRYGQSEYRPPNANHARERKPRPATNNFRQ